MQPEGRAGADEHCARPTLGAAASKMTAAIIGKMTPLALPAEWVMRFKPEASHNEEIRELHRAAAFPVFWLEIFFDFTVV